MSKAIVLSGWIALTSALSASTVRAQLEEGPVGPPQRDFIAATAFTIPFANAVPFGANDWDCVPSAEHPRPVVLVHGTAENRYNEWAQLAPLLKAQGYCVFAPNLGGIAGTGFRAMTDIPTSARQLAEYVEAVLQATGADQVDIVGHSQGGMLPRYYLKYLDGAAKVHHLIGLAPSNYGTDVFIVGAIAARLPIVADVVSLACLACEQQLVGSRFLGELNRGGDTVPGVSFTVIATAADEIVTPFTNTFLRDPGATNILLQDVCILDATDHFGITYDPIALQLVLNALDPSHARAPVCVPVPPVAS